MLPADTCGSGQHWEPDPAELNTQGLHGQCRTVILLFSLAQDHCTACCLQFHTDFLWIEGGFLPSSVCCAVSWDPHEERCAGISGCTQPWLCIYKRLLKPWGKKKKSVCRACLLSIQRSLMDPSPPASPKVLSIGNESTKGPKALSTSI